MNVMRATFVLLISLTIIALSLASCSPQIPQEALSLRPESLSFRQLQTRKYDTADEKMLLTAAANLLQDLGYQIDESEVDLGVIVASKHASAKDTAQIVGAVAFSVVFGGPVIYDDEQTIRVSIVTRPQDKQTALRVTFQRTVWNSAGRVARLEPLENVELYREFFNSLSKAVFLQGHDL